MTNLLRLANDDLGEASRLIRVARDRLKGLEPDTRLVEALRPFAALASQIHAAKNDDTRLSHGLTHAMKEQPTVGDCRRAAALLAELENPE